jgi:hypothetical protein
MLQNKYKHTPQTRETQNIALCSRTFSNKYTDPLENAAAIPAINIKNLWIYNYIYIYIYMYIYIYVYKDIYV